MTASRRFSQDALPSLRAALVLLSGRERRRTGRFTRTHVLILALAAEVIGLGIANAGRYRPHGILVDQPIAAGHVVT